MCYKNDKIVEMVFDFINENACMSEQDFDSILLKVDEIMEDNPEDYGITYEREIKDEVKL